MGVPVKDIEVFKGEDWSETYQYGGARQKISSSTNASPIVVTVPQHQLSNGDTVRIFGHNSNKGAIGNWTIANVTADTLELTGSTGTATGGSDGYIVPSIDATGATVTCTWKDSSIGGTTVLTPTFAWVDRTIAEYTLSLTDTQISGVTQDKLYYRMFYKDSLGIDTLILMGTVTIRTP